MWVNWAGDQGCAPAVELRPRETADVVAAVHGAGRHGQVVRAAGSGHSFTDGVLTDGVLLRLDAMDAVLGIDHAAGRVRVQAGISLRALSATLDFHGLALPNLGDIDVQTVAGATATGTHGTGARLPNLSAQVTAVQLVDAAGEVHELTEGDDLLAARVGLGALGVVTELELAVVPAFTLRAHEGPMPLAEVLDRLDELADGHDHFEFFAFPYARRVLAKRQDRVDDPPRPRGRLRAVLEDRVLANGVFAAAVALGRRAPAAVPTINRLLAAGLPGGTRVDRSHRVFATTRSVRFTELEYAVPRAAARELVEAVLADIERHDRRIGFPLELRLVAGDDALLSPAHGRDSAYLAAHVPAGMPFAPFLREVEAIARHFDGRPHWGKRHWRTAADLAPAYPAWDRFQAVRARLDPHGRFANAHLHRTLGDVAGAPAPV